jgi:1,4-alpha-glucan branching enzyme
VTALARSGETLAAFRRVHVAGLFEAEVSERPEYRLCIDWDGVIQETEDPYSFPPLLGELDVYLLAQGRHRRIAECLGAQPMTCEGAAGVRFAVWAPNARRVSVIGAFNTWDGRRHPMRLWHDCGVWEIFIPRRSRSTRCTRLPGDATPTGGLSRGWNWPTCLFPTCATSASRMSSSCR